MFVRLSKLIRVSNDSVIRARVESLLKLKTASLLNTNAPAFSITVSAVCEKSDTEAWKKELIQSNSIIVEKMVTPKFSTILEFSTILDFYVVQGNLLCREGRVYQSSVFLTKF